MKLFEFVKEFNMLLHPNEAKRPAKETKLQTRANFLKRGIKAYLLDALLIVCINSETSVIVLLKIAHPLL